MGSVRMDRSSCLQGSYPTTRRKLFMDRCAPLRINGDSLMGKTLGPLTSSVGSLPSPTHSARDDSDWVNSQSCFQGKEARTRSVVVRAHALDFDVFRLIAGSQDRSRPGSNWPPELRLKARPEYSLPARYGSLEPQTPISADRARSSLRFPD